MPLLMLLLFIGVPLAEIAVFIRVGEWIGLLPTILIVIATAILGTILLRHQGLSAFTRSQTALAEGRIPVEPVVDGVCLLVAGAFLLTPGMITDTIGFLLFVPRIRRTLARYAFRGFLKGAKVHVRTESTRTTASGTSHPPQGSGPVIDGEFERVDEPDSGSDQKPTRSSPQTNTPWRLPNRTR